MATKQTSAQKDKLQKMREQGKLSVQVAAEDGLLNPESFKDYDPSIRPMGAETDRIAAVITEFLDEHHSRDGKYKWEVGFFLPGSQQTRGGAGWQVLTPRALGPSWSEELQRRAGLHVHEGAICWAGRGMFERHIICGKTAELRERQTAAKEARLQELVRRQPESVAGEESELTVAETIKKIPLVPTDDEGGE